jgi:hypothetical protein
MMLKGTYVFPFGQIDSLFYFYFIFYSYFFEMIEKFVLSQNFLKMQ